MLATWALAALVAAVAVTTVPVQQSRVPSDTALVIIDIQNFYFEGGLIPLTKPVEASEQARRVLDAFRAKHLPVFHVRHVPTSVSIVDGEPVDPQYRIRPIVAPVPGEPVITKRFINSFKDTELLDLLHKANIKKLVIVGMQTHMCVEGATRAASDFGFDVTVLHDACATRPLEFNGHTAPAIDVHTTALAAVKGNYAKVVGVEEWLKTF